jgi:hypothetical protein
MQATLLLPELPAELMNSILLARRQAKKAPKWNVRGERDEMETQWYESI